MGNVCLMKIQKIFQAEQEREISTSHYHHCQDPETCSDPIRTHKDTVSVQFSSVQSLSCVWLFATPWTAACQASLFITNSQSLFKFMPIESVMPSNHFILCSENVPEKFRISALWLSLLVSVPFLNRTLFKRIFEVFIFFFFLREQGNKGKLSWYTVKVSTFCQEIWILVLALPLTNRMTLH